MSALPQTAPVDDMTPAIPVAPSGRPQGGSGGVPPQVRARQRPYSSGVWMATIRAVYVIWYRDIVRYTRDRVRLVLSLVQPILYLVIFGVGLSSSLGTGARGGSVISSVGYVRFVFPGVIGMAILFSAMFSAVSIVWDREFGFLREILVAPINRSAVAIGKTLGGATQAMIQGLVMLAFAPLAGVHIGLLTVLEVLPLLFVLAFAVSALGMALAARMRSMQGFQMVVNLVLMPMFFLGGSLFPLTALPAWMTVLTRLDPVAYGIAPVRHVILSGAGVPGAMLNQVAAVSIAGHTVPVLGEALLLLAFGLVMLGLGVYGFRRQD